MAHVSAPIVVFGLRAEDLSLDVTAHQFIRLSLTGGPELDRPDVSINAAYAGTTDYAAEAEAMDRLAELATQAAAELRRRHAEVAP